MRERKKMTREKERETGEKMGEESGNTRSPAQGREGRLGGGEGQRRTLREKTGGRDRGRGQTEGRKVGEGRQVSKSQRTKDLNAEFCFAFSFFFLLTQVFNGFFFPESCTCSPQPPQQFENCSSFRFFPKLSLPSFGSILPDFLLMFAYYPRENSVQCTLAVSVYSLFLFPLQTS